MPSFCARATGTVLALIVFGAGQVASQVTSSAPINYTGIPDGDYSTQWQSYFKVTGNLPGVSFNLGNSYAGNIQVQRPRHPNDTLFFWAFEKESGSLTAAAGASNAPWAIWLQGGPGTSSLYGLFTENGPLQVVPGKESLSQNQYAWSELMDYIWIDQPVGVGYATSDSDGYASDENQVADDFLGFLENLVKVFPSLATRPFYLTGESYAGRFIPYIAKALFSTTNPPVQLAKIVLGDPALGSNNEFKTMPTLSLIETYPQLIGYDTDVYDYFKEQSHLCGLDLNVSYPQTGGTFPSIELVSGQASDANPSSSSDQDDDVDMAARISKMKAKGKTERGFFEEVRVRHEQRRDLAGRGEERLSKRDVFKRSLSGRANGSIDPWYGCYVWDEMVDYAVNFTYPWSSADNYDDFDVPDALQPDVSVDPSFFLNNNDVQDAIHAPSQDWQRSISYPWGSMNSGSDPSPEPMVFLSELATNMSNAGVQMIIYVGNDDGISPHFGTEVTIQNTTFGGIQGFTRQPSSSWWDNSGQWAGIIHQERNWTYALIYGAGHEVAANRPIAAYTFVEQYVLGNNQTGLVQTANGTAFIQGGENPTLQQSALPGQVSIAYGSASTEGMTAWPTATIAAFESHVGFVSITGTGAVKPTATSKSGGLKTINFSVSHRFIIFLLSFLTFLLS